MSCQQTAAFQFELPDDNEQASYIASSLALTLATEHGLQAASIAAQQCFQLCALGDRILAHQAQLCDAVSFC